MMLLSRVLAPGLRSFISGVDVQIDIAPALRSSLLRNIQVCCSERNAVTDAAGRHHLASRATNTMPRRPQKRVIIAVILPVRNGRISAPYPATSQTVAGKPFCHRNGSVSSPYHMGYRISAWRNPRPHLPSSLSQESHWFTSARISLGAPNLASGSGRDPHIHAPALGITNPKPQRGKSSRDPTS